MLEMARGMWGKELDGLSPREILDKFQQYHAHKILKELFDNGEEF
jgi:hypothetical protein